LSTKRKNLADPDGARSIAPRRPEPAACAPDRTAQAPAGPERPAPRSEPLTALQTEPRTEPRTDDAEPDGPDASAADRPDQATGRLVRNASVVALGTLLSRVAGLARDQATAYFFGAGQTADAFFVAFRIPNFLRRLLAEGALTPAFVPVFSQRLKDQGLSGAADLFRGAFTFLALFLTGLTIAGVALAPQAVAALAPGFLKDPDQFALTVRLARIMFPYILLISLTSLAMGALNSLGQFTIPALGPTALNISMILGAALLSPRLETPVVGLAIGALAGGAAQLAIQLPALRRAGRFLGLSFNFRDPALKKTLLLMAPAALGGAAYQISILVNTQLVSFLPQGSVSWLYYADRLMQFPLGVFAIALATAALPALAGRAAAGDAAGFEKLLRRSLELQFFVALPAMVGLLALADPLVELLFQRGRFDPASSAATASALWAYALGLPFLSGVSILTRAFYSLSDTKTPAVQAAISLAIGLGLAVALMFPLKHVGLALASSLTSLVNFLWLAATLKRRRSLAPAPLLKEVLKYLSWALIMGLCLWPLHGPLEPGQGRLWRVALGLAIGPAVYFGLAAYFRCPHLAPLGRLAGRLKPGGRRKPAR
jgi:putative peptidoglycan lipid II flippase